MKLEKTLKKVRNAVVGVGLGAAVLFGSGCETMNEADWLAFAFGSVARDENKTKEQRENAAYLEQIAKEQAQRQHEKELAEASKDETKQEVNVYVEREKENVQQKPSIEPKLIDEYDIRTKKVGDWVAPPLSFTCSGFKDLNGDGYIGKNELIKLSNYFKCEEQIKILCGSLWSNAKGNLITSKITETKTGEIIKIHNGNRLQSNGESRWTRLNLNKSNKNKGIKEYTLEWLVDGKLIPTRTINFFVDYGQNTQQTIQQPQQNQKNLGEFLIYNNWNDANHNKIIEKNELSGLGKKVFNLDREKMEICFISDKPGVITFESWYKGVCIGKTERSYPNRYQDCDEIRHLTGLSEIIPNGDFMDRIHENGPGNYTITAYFKGNDGTAQYNELDVKIVK